MRVHLPRTTAWLLWIAVLTAACQPTTETGDPGVADYETTLVVEGVYQFRFEAHNTMFVVTDDGVVAFDPISVEAATHYAAEIGRVAPAAPLLAIVYSHHHADHASGAQILRDALGPDAPILAHENAAPLIVAMADPDLPAPTVTFSEFTTLYFGGEPIELHYLGANHSDNSIVARLPERGVAFAVDFVANDRVAYQDFPGTVFPDFFDSIERLSDMDFDVMIFGHGPSGDMAAIDRQVEYYAALRAAVQAAADAGLSEDEAAEEVDLPQFHDFGQYEEWFALNVRGLYRWVTNGGD